MFTRRKNRSLWADAGLVVAGSLVLSACAGGPDSPGPAANASNASGEPQFGGNITVQIPQDPGSLDSAVSGNVSTSVISRHIFESLFAPNENHEPTPVLATGYERSDDGLTWTIGVRTGVEFSDGTPLVAEDAVASIEYWLEHSSFADSLAPILEEISAPDDETVIIRTSVPFHLLNLISTSEGARVVKAETARSASATGFGKDEVIGTGPYKLQSWDTEEIVIERN